MFNYARKWWHVLVSGRANEIEGQNGRKHIMMSLSNLSKFLGCYGRWKEMKEQSQLKWRQKSSVDVFQAIYNSHVSDVVGWVDEILGFGDDQLSMVTVFMGLTGLRCCESIMALNRIGEKGLSGYLRGDVLEHFKYKEFLRGNKNAFVSVIPEELLHELESWEMTGVKYSTLAKRLYRKGMVVKFYDLRRWHATTLRMGGVASEICDLLQGRVSGSILVESYLRPDFKTVIEKVKEIMSPYAQEWLRSEKKA